MPFVVRDGARIYWRSDGRPDAPPLLLANSLGTDHPMWDPVVPVLAQHFRVLRFDKRGHGASEAPRGEYTMEQLAGDALAVADAAGAARFSFAGISIGGMIGLWIGAYAGDRVERLVLSTTSAKVPSDPWADRIARIRAGGMAGIVDAVFERWFTARFRARNDAYFAGLRENFLATSAEGYIGCCAAIRDMDLRDWVSAIRAPTLVITATHDISIPKEHGEALAASIDGAMRAELPVAHLPLEEPGLFAHTLLRFLLHQGVDTEHQRFEAGLERRKRVLGRDYVEQRIKQVKPFNAEYQDLITRYAWGEMWTRHAFDDRTRRLFVLAMMLALARWDEFEMHVRAGFAAELSPHDLKEVLLLACVYCGVPIGNSGFHRAAALMREAGIE